MCGIHFVINADTYNSKLSDYMHDAFIANAVRGTHSSGVFQVKDALNENKRHPVEYLKLPVNGSTFLENPAVKDIVRGACSELVTVGHVRHATSGGVTIENAHPFMHKRAEGTSLIGVHNGSLLNWRGHKDAHKHNVDSAWLFEQLATKGAEAFKLFDGAFALVWYDSALPNRLFVARNDKRTLYWAYSEDKKIMIAASEMGMLKWLADRNSIKLWKNDKGHQLFFPNEGVIYNINIAKPDEYLSTTFDKFDYTTLRGSSSVIGQAPFHSAAPAANTASGGNRAQDGTNRTPVTHRRTDPPSRQLVVLQGIKKVLKDARDAADLKELGGDEIITNEVLEVGMHKALTAWQNKREVAGCEFVDVIFSQKASANEAKMAKEAGMLGLIVDFCGYLYDPSTSEVFGDFQLTLDGKTVTHDAQVRFIPKTLADDKYISPTKTTKMVVVGMIDDYLILDDLDAGHAPRTKALEPAEMN